jgi:hypothetical protein
MGLKANYLFLVFMFALLLKYYGCDGVLTGVFLDAILPR